MNVDRIVELSNGCICCSGILQLGIAIQEIIASANPTLILIESSGVSEVAPLITELRGVGLRTDAVITVVDAENVSSILQENSVATGQVENADFLVLNKTDLVSPAAVEKVEAVLRGLNSRSLIFKTQYGSVETHLLFASSVRRYRAGAEDQPKTDSTRSKTQNSFKSFVYQAPGNLNRNSFIRFLKKLPRDIDRSKGIVHFDEESQPAVFNYVCGRYSIDWISLERSDRFANQAVFIGHNLERHKEKVLESIKLCWKT